jgi:hypothetical protein
MCEALNQVNERCITAIAEVETANDAVRRSGRVSVPSRRTAIDLARKSIIEELKNVKVSKLAKKVAKEANKR